MPSEEKNLKLLNNAFRGFQFGSHISNITSVKEDRIEGAL